MSDSYRILLAVAMTCLLSSAAGADTTRYTGSATSYVNRQVMPLGNGDLVVAASSHGVAAISTTPPTLLDVRCMGMGPANEENGMQVAFFCTFKANDSDSFDVRGTDTAAGGDAEVIGGSGKWQGATGKGRFVRVDAGEESSASTFEFDITTP